MKKDSWDKVIIFLVYLALLFCITLFSSCSKDDLFPNKKIEMNIDTRLPKDVNGYYHFKLYSSTTQNIHTISGTITNNGKVPDNPREKVEWENNLYWNLRKGDTLATITKTYLNYYTGQFVVVKLPPLVSNINAFVPTINSVCYNSADGSINTVIAPKWEMRGDTMIVVAKSNGLTKIAKIVLD